MYSILLAQISCHASSLPHEFFIVRHGLDIPRGSMVISRTTWREDWPTLKISLSGT